MKKYILISSCMLLLFMFSNKAHTQQLFFFYVGPAATLDATFPGATFGFTRPTSTGTEPAMTGYRGVNVTAANLAAFNSIASPAMKRTYDSINTPTSTLRIKLNKVLSLAGNRLSTLAIFLTDDRTGMPENATVCTQPVGGVSIAWPCASNWRDNAINAYRAKVNLGERAANLDMARAGGFRRWEATIIHEVSHTQMLADPDRVNKFDDRNRGIDGIAIAYGGDAGHWFEELQATPQMALDEGLGYFWAIEHNPPMATELDAFLNQTTPRFLLGSRSFLTGSSEMWNAPHQVRCTGLPCIGADGTRMTITLNTDITPAGGGYELRTYRWLDVPGKFVFYNELMCEAYFYLFHQYAFNERDTAYNKIYDAVKTLSIHPNQLYRYPAHAANMLANSMEAYANSPAGARDASSNVLASSMFAYALYDLLGHFSMSEEALRTVFDNNSATFIPHTPKPRAFTAYWARRNQIKQLACPFLGGANCLASNTGPIDIHGAVRAVRNYLRDPNTILR